MQTPEPLVIVATPRMIWRAFRRRPGGDYPCAELTEYRLLSPEISAHQLKGTAMPARKIDPADLELPPTESLDITPYLPVPFDEPTA